MNLRESKWLRDVPDHLVRAIWEGDENYLNEVARCGCCCDEHFHEGCEARLWGGCRGQGSLTRSERESWIRHYEVFHGMTRDVFFGVDP